MESNFTRFRDSGNGKIQGGFTIVEGEPSPMKYIVNRGIATLYVDNRTEKSNYGTDQIISMVKMIQLNFGVASIMDVMEKERYIEKVPVIVKSWVFEEILLSIQ